MDQVGISFRAPLSSAEVHARVIVPLKRAVERDALGIYSNYLNQGRDNPHVDTEHLIVFEVQDFKEGLRVLRLSAEKLPLSTSWEFHNLNPSDPPY